MYEWSLSHSIAIISISNSLHLFLTSSLNRFSIFGIRKIFRLYLRQNTKMIIYQRYCCVCMSIFVFHGSSITQNVYKNDKTYTTKYKLIVLSIQPLKELAFRTSPVSSVLISYVCPVRNPILPSLPIYFPLNFIPPLHIILTHITNQVQHLQL